MVDNELNFLSSTIYLEGGTFNFRPHRKNGSETILTNYKKATISKKYLVSNISTMLHNAKNSSSNDQILLHDIETNLKPILLKNSYPFRLVESKCTQFLQYGPKPKPPDVTFTLCISYSSKNIDFHVQKMIKEIKLILPNFYVRLAYKGVKVSNLFSSDAKPSKPRLDTINCVYHFKCLCLSNYVGMTARKVQTRAKEHRTFSTAKNIYYHINSCPNYLGRLLKFEHENFKPEDKINVKKKLRDVFFMEHFTILQKVSGHIQNVEKRRHFSSEYSDQTSMNRPNTAFLHYFDMWAFFKIDFAHTILFSHLLEIRFKKRRFSSQAF